MPNELEKLYNLPDISFIDGMTAEELLEEMRSDYESVMEEMTEEPYTFREKSKMGAALNTVALKMYQIMQYVDRAGKMNLLKYSTGEALEHLVALRGVFQQEGAAAVCKVRFRISEEQASVITIPSGTRVSGGGDVYFETYEDVEIPSGATQVETMVQCMETGDVGNGFAVGKINTVVDPFPYCDSVENITASDGGCGKKTEEELKEEAILAPSGHSTAGTEDSYVYWCRKYSAKIQDIRVNNPQGTDIELILTGKENQSLSENFLRGLERFLKSEHVLPQTDHVTARCATEAPYCIDVTYYINVSDKMDVAEIQARVEEAVQSFNQWQQEKIGRDINPEYLSALLIVAGIKRSEIRQPVRGDVDEASIARLDGKISLIYGGTEDD